MEIRHPTDAARRMDRVAVCLDGLSVGDALGERFFGPGALALVAARALPKPFWFYTDDTEMALGIAHVLDLCGHIDQDELAAVFAHRYQRNPRRGYGATAHQILMAICDGKDWRSASRSAFHGEGSMGNGAAMRVAPVGAYFADDDEMVVRQAALSAEVTHAHPEGIAGAIAVAVAAAWAARLAQQPQDAAMLFERVLAFTPKSETRAGLERARSLSKDIPVPQAAAVLGNGSGVVAPDTVPLALWCAARHINSFEEAIWAMLSAGGDIDTNCAIVGGIVALAAGREAIPRRWLESREDLR